MEINVQLPDDFFSTDELDRLRRLLGSQSDAELEAALESVIRAALAEYKDMLLGMGMPSRAVEIREHRLFQLIKHYFRDRVPSEAQVASMFHLTESASRSLIRSVISKFEYYLEDQLEETLKATIASSEFDPEGRVFTITFASDETNIGWASFEAYLSFPKSVVAIKEVTHRR